MKNTVENEKKRNCGRPKSENPRNKCVHVKFRTSEFKALLEAADRFNMTVSDILRRGMWLEIHELEAEEMRKFAKKTPL